MQPLGWGMCHTVSVPSCVLRMLLWCFTGACRWDWHLWISWSEGECQFCNVIIFYSRVTFPTANKYNIWSIIQCGICLSHVLYQDCSSVHLSFNGSYIVVPMMDNRMCFFTREKCTFACRHLCFGWTCWVLVFHVSCSQLTLLLKPN